LNAGKVQSVAAANPAPGRFRRSVPEGRFSGMHRPTVTRRGFQPARIDGTRGIRQEPTRGCRVLACRTRNAPQSWILRAREDLKWEADRLTPAGGVLIAAKHRTYAAGGSDSVYAVPPSSRIPSAGVRIGRPASTDVYFGEAHFAGQEVVYMNAIPVWSCATPGGRTATLEPAEIERLAGFFRPRCGQCRPNCRFEDATFGESPYVYVNHPQGELRRFEGSETIQRGRASLQARVHGGRLD